MNQPDGYDAGDGAPGDEERSKLEEKLAAKQAELEDLTDLLVCRRTELKSEVRDAFIADGASLLANLAEAMGSNESSDSSWGPFWKWPSFWKSPSTVALITVAIGGVFVAVINGCIQDDIQTRELRHDIVSAVNTGELNRRIAALEDQAQSGREAIGLAGMMTGRTQDYVVSFSTKYSYPPGNTDKEKKVRATLDQEIEALRVAFNAAGSKWQERHVADGVLLAYAYNSDEVRRAWNEVVKAVNAYRRFALDLDPKKHTPEYWETRFWIKEENAIHAALKKLKEEMRDARTDMLSKPVDTEQIKKLLSKLQAKSESK